MGEQRRLAVVSGGGTGIGAAIASALAADGYDLVSPAAGCVTGQVLGVNGGSVLGR